MFVPKFISLNWSVPASPFNFPPRTDMAEMVNCNGSWDHLTKKKQKPPDCGGSVNLSKH